MKNRQKGNIRKSKKNMIINKNKSEKGEQRGEELHVFFIAEIELEKSHLWHHDTLKAGERNTERSCSDTFATISTTDPSLSTAAKQNRQQQQLLSTIIVAIRKTKTKKKKTKCRRKPSWNLHPKRLLRLHKHTNTNANGERDGERERESEESGRERERNKHLHIVTNAYMPYY